MRAIKKYKSINENKCVTLPVCFGVNFTCSHRPIFIILFASNFFIHNKELKGYNGTISDMLLI